MINSVVTQASGVFVLKPIDNNHSSSGQSQLIPACVVYANKGPVGKPVRVSGDDWQSVFGRPLPMSAGEKAEGLRQLKDALSVCSSAVVVRAMPDNALYPVVTFSGAKSSAAPAKTGDKAAVKSATAQSALAYGVEPTMPAGGWLSVWPVDGDPSVNRSVAIESVDAGKKRFVLAIKETVNGQERVLESHKVGLDPDDVDDLGLSAYAPAVLENSNSRFRCLLTAGTQITDVVAQAIVFSGGTNGSDPTTDNWKAAWDLLKSDDVDYTHGFAAGIYDKAVLAHAAGICSSRLSQFKLDVPPSMTEEAAKAWLTELNVDDYQVQAIHYPYKALDEWFGGKSVWGASGELIAAKARCFQTPTGHAAVAGVHFAPAGEKRGRIARRNIEPLHATGKLTPEKLVDARITPVAKGAIINDVLNLWQQENYLRFEHVVAIHNDLCHEFIDRAGAAKFEPDGLTREVLEAACRDLGDKRVSAGAFVVPRNAADGSEPYVAVVEQKEIDLWQVTFSFCPTGVARRIALQPILIK